ncbi:MAG: sulfurtransferase [Nocardioidaceae bacterium]
MDHGNGAVEPARTLVQVAELGRLLGEVTVLDVRWQLGRDDGYQQYLAGHVPTARYVDLATDLAEPRNPAHPPGPQGRHPLPDPERFAAAMRRCGVSRGRPVVVYDDWSSMAATRAWWLLRFHGHRNVRVLDGGWGWWRREGGAVETGPARAGLGGFDADPGHLPVLDADGAARTARSGVLIDARAPERYRGETEPVDPVAGHVPGAVNVPTAANLSDGRFRPVPELAEVYRATRPRADGTPRPVGVYCGSGVTATHDLLALHLLGREAVLYPASWSGWVSDPDRPVERDETNLTKPRG